MAAPSVERDLNPRTFDPLYSAHPGSRAFPRTLRTPNSDLVSVSLQ